MGIRFLCKHCEKRLNVKAVQAGEEGTCPHCLGRIIVPSKSTLPNALKKKHRRRKKKHEVTADDSAIRVHAVDEQVTMDGVPAENRHQESAPKNNRGRNYRHDSDSGIDEQSAEPFTLDKPQLPATIGKVDPIAESPTSVWYFRSRELGEKGPFKGKQMQEHLDQGNVKIGCIVWREDWHDWIPAERVFPSLVAEDKSNRQKTKVARAIKESNYQLPIELDPENDLHKRRRRKNQIFASAIAIGILIIIVLLTVLLTLVSNNP